MNLNNSSELLTCADGATLYILSKGKNEFQPHRELHLVSIMYHTGNARTAKPSS